MTTLWFASLAVGCTLGLLGGGGSVLMVPVLIYLGGVSAPESIALSLLVVGATAFVSLVVQARRKLLDLRLGLFIGAMGMVGAFAGGQVARFFSSEHLLTVFAALMLIAAYGMLRRRSATPAALVSPPCLRRAGLIGIGVGFLAGGVGAGGGFLLIPALVYWLALPIRQAIATSLLVLVMQSLSGALAHLLHTPLDLQRALPILATSLAGGLIGAYAAPWVSQQLLRRLLGVLIASLGGWMLLQHLQPTWLPVLVLGSFAFLVSSSWMRSMEDAPANESRAPAAPAQPRYSSTRLRLSSVKERPTPAPRRRALRLPLHTSSQVRPRLH